MHRISNNTVFIHSNTLRYCSRECQVSHWKSSHKSTCRKHKANYDVYTLEKEGKQKVPQDCVNDEAIRLKRFDPEKLRFKVGQRVECQIGDDDFAVGKIIKLMDNDHRGNIYPYQVQLDPPLRIHGGKIWVIWDADHQCRAVDANARTKVMYSESDRTHYMGIID